MNRTILLVEDSEDDVFFMKRALKLAGIPNPVQVVMDGQAALDYLAGEGLYADRVRFPLPALVLLDLRLPLVPGLDVLKWMRSQPRLCCVPVVVLTSSRQDVDIQRTYSIGGNSFLVKPSDASELVAMVKIVGQYWLNYNQVPSPEAFVQSTA